MICKHGTTLAAYFASPERMRKCFASWSASMSSSWTTLASSHTLPSKLTALHLWTRIIEIIFLHLQLFYPGWFASFWWSSHLARHCIRSVEGCVSVLYSSQLLEDKALLASNKEELVLWLPTRLKMEASRRCKIWRSFSQIFAIVLIVQPLRIMDYCFSQNWSYFNHIYILAVWNTNITPISFSFQYNMVHDY